jgi:ATP-dependent RNA helicase DeaD
VGHIDLLDTISYFEVPEKDALKVSTQLTGIRFKGRTVRCNNEDDGARKPQRENEGRETRNEGRKDNNRRRENEGRGARNDRRQENEGRRTRNDRRNEGRENNNGDWRELMRQATEDNRKQKKSRTPELRGEKPDFSEEGWARRKPKRRK